MKKTKPDPAKLTAEEATALLSIHTEERKGKQVKRVHTFEGTSFGPMGCDIDLTGIKKYIKASEHICLSGPNMRGMGHGVAVHIKDKGYLFLETDKDKLAQIMKERKIK